jgi:RNA polymerase sigma-70 factor (ECF subfamily)
VNMDIKLLHLDDESLISQIQEGSHEAFATLVNRHPNLWDPSKGTKFTTWFYRVVINLCLDYRKKKKLVNISEGLEFADEKPGADILLDVHQKQALLERLICELPERQQLAINLCFYEGLSNNEAAQIIGVRVKALQSLIMRAKITLRYKVKRYLDGGHDDHEF